MSQTLPLPTNNVAICTVVTGNYLHFARALVRSIRRFHPEISITVCVVDHASRLPELDDPHTSFVFADQLQLSAWPRFRFQYSAFELSCALKPAIIKHCLSRPGISRTIYLDADIQLYQRLDPFLRDTRASSIALTPHLLTAVVGGESEVMRRLVVHSGVYNAGFLSVRRTNSGCAFLDWWQSILVKSSIVDAMRGMYVDQRPLDLVPGLFDGVEIVRQIGFHLAYWNLHEDRLFADGDTYRLGCGNNLTLFHFSGIDPEDPDVLSKYVDPSNVSDDSAVRALVANYVNDLNACDRSQYERLPYGFAQLSDGTEIVDAWREAIRMDHDALLDVQDPFDVSRYPDLHRRFRIATPDAMKSRRQRRTRLTKRFRGAVKRLFTRAHQAA